MNRKIETQQVDSTGALTQNIEMRNPIAIVVFSICETIVDSDELGVFIKMQGDRDTVVDGLAQAFEGDPDFFAVVLDAIANMKTGPGAGVEIIKP